jgi:hypothetical protein
MDSRPDLQLRNDLLDLKVTYQIDRDVLERWEAGSVTHRFREASDAVWFARHALAAAAKIALVEGDQANFGKYIGEWDRAHELSRQAHSSLLRLIAWLCNRHGEAGMRAALRQMRRRKGVLESSLHPRSFRDAQLLHNAAALLADFQEFAEDGARRLRKGRRNPGDPGKRVFVLRMAEAWVVLTGRLPGANKMLDANPFLRFAAHGWTDLGGSIEGASFAQSALGHALTRLKRMPASERSTFVPTWWRDTV